MTDSVKSADGLIRSAAKYSLGTTLYKLHVLLVLPIFVFAYSETEMGSLELALFVGGLAIALASFNLQAVVSHRYALSPAERRPIVAAQGLVSMATMTGVALVVSGFIVAAQSFLVPEIGDRSVLLVAVLVGSSLSALSGNCSVLFQLRSKPRWFNRLYLSWALIVLSGTAAAAMASDGAEGYAFSMIVAGIVSIGLTVVGLRAEIRSMRREPHWGTDLAAVVRSDIRRGATLLPLMLLGWLLLTVDRKILSVRADLAEVGIYGAAVRIANAVTVVLGPLQVAWWDIAMNRDEADVPGFLRRLLWLQGLGTLLFVSGAVVAGQGPIPALLGDWFQPGIRLVPTLVICATLLSGYVIPSALLTKDGRFRAMTAAYAAAVAANLTLNLVLAGPYGAVGATFANLVSYFLLTALTWLPVRSVLREATSGQALRIAAPYGISLVLALSALLIPSLVLTGW